MKNKRGQVAIWVILAIILAAVILLFFLIQRKPIGGAAVEFDIEPYIEKCTTESVNEAIDIMLPQGGFLEPQNYRLFNKTKVAYLCENPGFFKPCTNNHPMLINEMREELRGYITPRVESCFESMKKEAENRNWEVELGEMNLSVAMAPGRVFVNIAREAKVTKNEGTITFEKFDVKIINPAYDLANIAIEIANNEAKYCNFQYLGYMILYPRWDIKLNTFTSVPGKIYTIEDKNSGKKMNIAIRSCAIPTGIWFG
jgi:hypothetical protein